MAHNNIALPLIQERRLDAALAHLQTALKLRPNNPDVIATLADAYGQIGIQSGNVQFHLQALELANHVLAIDHNNKMARRVRVAALFYSGKRELAISELGDLIRDDPDDKADLLVMRGNMYAQNGQEELARRDFLQAQTVISAKGSVRALKRELLER